MVTVSILGLIQMSTSLNNLSKATRVAARSAALQPTKKEAEKYAKKAIDMVTTVKNLNLTNINAQVSYADNEKKFYLVKTSAKIKNPVSFLPQGRVYHRRYVVAIESQQGFSSGGINAAFPGTAKPGETIVIPSNLGDSFTYTPYDYFTFGVGEDGGHHKVWSHGSTQEALAKKWVAQGCKQIDGVAAIDGLYLIATTPLFGNVGDMVRVDLCSGKTLNCIIGDAKELTDEGATIYGHDGGHTVVEVESVAHKSNPWGKQRVKQITNMGKYTI